MDRQEVYRILQRLSELERHRKPFEPVLRYRPPSVERPDYKGLSDQETKVFESAIEILLCSGIGKAADQLKFDGWQETSSPDLIERIEITRAIHRFNARFYERDIPGHDPEIPDETISTYTFHLRSVGGAHERTAPAFPIQNTHPSKLRRSAHSNSGRRLCRNFLGAKIRAGSTHRTSM